MTMLTKTVGDYLFQHQTSGELDIMSISHFDDISKELANFRYVDQVDCDAAPDGAYLDEERMIAVVTYGVEVNTISALDYDGYAVWIFNPYDKTIVIDGKIGVYSYDLTQDFDDEKYDIESDEYKDILFYRSFLKTL